MTRATLLPRLTITSGLEWCPTRWGRGAASAALASVALFLAAPAHAAEDDELEIPHNEFTLVPFVGGDSDVGLGGGYIASLARVSPNLEPYLFRVESATTITFKSGDESAVEMPYLDSYLLLDMPHVVRNRLRLEFRVSYTREATLKYYGLGNASTIPEGRDRSSAFFEHERIHPTFRLRARYRLTEHLLLTWGAAYTQNWITIGEDTLLARDMREGTDTVRSLLGSDDPHGVAEFSYGFGWDTRDNEVSPVRGQFHTVRVDLAPGGYDGIPNHWGRLDVAARFYMTLVPKRVTFAARVLSDLLFGQPPFYELPRFDDTSAIGGVKGVRGVPAQRYYGKAKLLSNLELRTELFDFPLFGKTNTFGITGFFDSGRVWADYEDHADLDGTELGLKYGAGGGLRIRAGESFVLRIDAAWSPDADPIGGYISSGHVF